jgi:hypothetical protein
VTPTSDSNIKIEDLDALLRLERKVPGDYDGIVAGAPEMNRAHTGAANIWNYQAFNGPAKYHCSASDSDHGRGCQAMRRQRWWFETVVIGRTIFRVLDRVAFGRGRLASRIISASAIGGSAISSLICPPTPMRGLR